MAPTVTNSLESFAAGAETAVDVAQIERQLAELWQLAAESDTAAVTRACLFNLVAICDTEAARDRATETIRIVTSRHPCRAIVLLAQPAATTDELAASITAHCHLAGGGGKQVCCEQISIHATGRSVAQLAGAVLPLLESDLPTINWWLGDFLETPLLFRRLCGVADRVFFDTSTWPAAPARLVQLAAAMNEQRQCVFCDLSWTRLEFWRRMTAEMFDPPECAAEVSRLQSAEIIYGDGPGAQLRARLYGGWLATQLGWSAPDAVARLTFEQREEPDTSGCGITMVTIRSAAAQFIVRKNYGEQVASTVVHMPDACGLPRKRAFWPTDDAALLSQELDAMRRDSLYARVLALTVELTAAARS